jgi:hypothetical protein
MISCDVETALSFFNKWKNEASSVRAICSAGGVRDERGKFLSLGASFDIIGDVSVEPAGIVGIKGDGREFIFDLTGCSLRYGEPDEADESIRASSKGKYVCCLEARSPDNVFLAVFFELRERFPR